MTKRKDSAGLFIHNNKNMTVILSLFILSLLGQTTNSFVIQQPRSVTNRHCDLQTKTTRTAGRGPSVSVAQSAAAAAASGLVLEDQRLGIVVPLKKEKRRPSFSSKSELVHDLQDMEDFFCFIQDEALQDQLRVVKFYANYCKVCQRTKIILKSLAQKERNNNGIDFATLEIGAAGGGKIFKKLGVNKTPYVQIYRNGLCVASFSTGAAHNFRGKTTATIELNLERTAEEWNEFLTTHASLIAEQHQCVNDVRAMATMIRP